MNRSPCMGAALGGLAFGTLLVLGAASSAPAQITFLDSFNPAEGGSMNSIGFDPVADEVYLHFSGNTSVHIYNRSGVFQRSITKPSMIGGNDDDLEFADEAINLNGTNVPANSLLLVENDNSPPRIIGANKADGAAIATQNLTVSGLVGGSYHEERNTFFVVSFTADTISEVRPSDGMVLNTFPVTPAGAPIYDVFFGDVEVRRRDGNLYVVSDSQDTLRILSPTGQFIRDVNLALQGVDEMSGIAFDDNRDEAWISGEATGVVYHVVIPEPAGFGLLTLGGGWLLVRGRRR